MYHASDANILVFLLQLLLLLAAAKAMGECFKRFGQPARFVFLVLTGEQEVEWQVHILGAVARALLERDVRERILDADDVVEAHQALREALRRQQILTPAPSRAGSAP